MTGEESKITLSAEQKSALTEGVVWGTLTIMKGTITRENPKKCATNDSKRYSQSRTALSDNTVSINVLTHDVKLPARPRDFRYGLAEEHRNIGMSELSDVLSSLRRRQLLDHSERNIPFSRGRPISDSAPNNERRGRKSYYYKSKANQIIEQVLSDQEYFKKIDNAVCSSKIFLEHRVFSIEAGLQLKAQAPRAFLNTYSPFIKRYGLKELQNDSTYINKDDITDELIEKIAVGLARDTKLSEIERKAIYTIGGMRYLDHIMQLNQPSTS